MAYVKEHAPSEVYHLAKKENLNSILDDGMIRRFSDTECWFCADLQKMRAYMEQTVMCEGKPYYNVTGQLCRYPKFVPEDYVLLKLIPCRQKDNWYRWEQEIPAGSPAALVRAAREFSALKIGYRGDLAFHNAEVIDVPQFLVEGVTQGEPVQTNTELWDILSQRIEDEMADYMRRLDLRTRDELIQTADEIDAMMTCDCELRPRWMRWSSRSASSGRLYSGAWQRCSSSSTKRRCLKRCGSMWTARPRLPQGPSDR